MGSPAPAWLWLVAVALLVAVAVLQSPHAEPGPTHEELVAAACGETVSPPEGNTLVLLAKLGILLKDGSSQSAAKSDLLQFVDQVSGNGPPSMLGPSATPNDPGPEAADLVRAAIVAGELGGPHEALARLDQIEPALSPASPLVEDVQMLRGLYGEEVDWMPVKGMTGLVERHGWLGRLAVTAGTPAGEAMRQQAASDALLFAVVVLIVGLGFVLAMIAGTVLLIAGGVSRASGGMQPMFARPNAGSRLYVETFIVFAGGFLLLKPITLGVQSLAGQHATWPMWIPLIGQWVLLLSPLWPMVRGMSWQQLSGEMGWHRGRGLFREVGAGIVAYVAFVPIYFFVALLVVIANLIVQAIQGPSSERLPHNKIMDILQGGDTAMLVVIALMIVLWAPLVEESIFRGALYRSMRGRLPMIAAALLTAACFAAMHAYVLSGLFVVGALGVCFAVMREWRSSLIPSMTAHCLHNSIVLIVMATTLHTLRG